MEQDDIAASNGERRDVEGVPVRLDVRDAVVALGGRSERRRLVGGVERGARIGRAEVRATDELERVVRRRVVERDPEPRELRAAGDPVRGVLVPRRAPRLAG